MKILVNWIKTDKGNAINEGTVLTVSAKGAHHISGGIYVNGSPIIAIFGSGETAKVKVARKGMKLAGKQALLKIRAYDEKYRGFGIDDIFEIV